MSKTSKESAIFKALGYILDFLSQRQVPHKNIDITSMQSHLSSECLGL